MVNMPLGVDGSEHRPFDFKPCFEDMELFEIWKCSTVYVATRTANNTAFYEKIPATPEDDRYVAEPTWDWWNNYIPCLFMGNKVYIPFYTIKDIERDLYEHWPKGFTMEKGDPPEEFALVIERGGGLMYGDSYYRYGYKWTMIK